MRAAALAAVLALAPAAAQDASTPGVAGAEAVVQAFAEGDLERAFTLTDPAETRELADILRSFSGDGEDGRSPAEVLAEVFATLIGEVPEMDEAMGSVDAVVLGTVPEGDSLAHVVGRASFSLFGGEMGGVEVTTARWDGARWWVSFGARLDAMRRGIRMAEDG